ncbi:hypothetical protein [Streptomyces sp. NPDC058632]
MREKSWTAVVTGATAVAALLMDAGSASAAAADIFCGCGGGAEQYWY